MKKPKCKDCKYEFKKVVIRCFGIQRIAHRKVKIKCAKHNQGGENES